MEEGREGKGGETREGREGGREGSGRKELEGMKEVRIYHFRRRVNLWQARRKEQEGRTEGRNRKGEREGGRKGRKEDR